jgi:hypothetical protein
MRGPGARIRLVLLALLLSGALGAPCGGGAGGKVWVVLLPDANQVEPWSLVTVEVWVTSPVPVQAFDLALQWDPEMIQAFMADPHPDFDDDGVLFTSPQFDLTAGTLERVVDLRHGGEGVQGSFRIATLYFYTMANPGTATIQVTGSGVASGDGNEPPATALPLTITIES